MELKLTEEDLKPKYRNLNTSQAKYVHFSLNAQKAIKIVGRAQYIWRDTYNAIYPPNSK